mmetsp:Transcript_38628/g.115972  ORF Transcript_38628/g.115972 Transcript_38628/m.115972 type:complete len:214 (-) Transcript_38628:1078-1719(-)
MRDPPPARTLAVGVLAPRAGPVLDYGTALREELDRKSPFLPGLVPLRHNNAHNRHVPVASHRRPMLVDLLGKVEPTQFFKQYPIVLIHQQQSLALGRAGLPAMHEPHPSSRHGIHHLAIIREIVLVQYGDRSQYVLECRMLPESVPEHILHHVAFVIYPSTSARGSPRSEPPRVLGPILLERVDRPGIVRAEAEAYRLGPQRDFVVRPNEMFF